jgi:glutamyl-tRNA synthetase
MRRTGDRELAAKLVDALPHLEGGNALGAAIAAQGPERLVAAMAGLKERAKTLVELADAAGFLYAVRPLALDEKAAALLDQQARARLAAMRELLAALAEWSAPATEAAVREFAEKSGLKLGQAAQPLRAALTGRTTSPPVFDVMAVLGREESLARIGDQCK